MCVCVCVSVEFKKEGWASWCVLNFGTVANAKKESEYKVLFPGFIILFMLVTVPKSGWVFGWC